MNRDVGQVIGKGGEKIKSIRKESGARVNIKSLIPNSNERIGDVTGDIMGVSQALRMIATSISDERPCITLLAESRNLGAVIGKGGSTINQIRTDSQANVDIGRECLGNSSMKEIQITGQPDAVSQAIDSIVKYLAEGTSRVRVPYEPLGGGGFHRPMQGRGDLDRGDRGRGDRARGYGRRSDRGGGFNMSPMFGNRGMQYQDGPDSNQSRGRAHPSGLRIETIVYVPKDIIGKIIGRSGSNINSIRRQSGATIKIVTDDNNEPERKITITGRKDSMDLAYSMIDDLASSF